MASELLFAQDRLLLAREAVYGTDEIDLANNLAVAREYQAFTEIAFTPQGGIRERAIRRPSFSPNRGIYIRENLGVRWAGYMTAPSVAGNPVEGMGDAMVFAGMSEVDGGTATTYAPTTTAQAGGSAYHWLRHVDAYLWRLIYATGIRGNFECAGEAGQLATWAFDGQSNNFPQDSTQTSDPHGYSLDLAYFDADGTILLDKNGDAIVYVGAETLSDPAPLILESAVITVGGTPYPCRAFRLNHNNVVTPKLVTSSDPTVNSIWITGRNITLELDLEDTGAAWEAAVDAALDSTELASTIVLTDRLGAGGTTLTISAPKLQLDMATLRDSGGLAAWTIPCIAVGDWSNELGDNEITYVFSVTP